MTRRPQEVGRAALAWLPFLLAAFGPLAVLLWSSVHSGEGDFSLEAYRSVWGRSGQRVLLWHSLVVGVTTALLTTLVGGLYGFLVARTDLRGRAIYSICVLAPLLIPPYVAGIAWTQVLRVGGFWAIVLLLGGGLVSIPAFLAARAFRAVSADIEDSARLHRGPLAALRNVTVPLALPSLATAALLVFVFAVTDFVIPDFFSFAGIQEKSYQVAAMDVFARWTVLREKQEAIVAAVPLFGVAALGALAIAWIEGCRSRAAVTGSGGSPRPYRLGRLAPLAHLFLLAVLVLSAVVPLSVLVGWVARGTSQTQATVTAPPPEVEASLEEGATPLEQGLVVFVLDNVGRSKGDFLRTVGYSGAAALIVLLIGFAPAGRLVRAGQLGRRRVAALAAVLVPLACPGLLVAIAQVRLFNRPGSWWDEFYTGGGLVIWTLAVRYAPIGLLGLRAVREQLEPSLEESARLAVASPIRRLFGLLVPWLAPGIVGVGLLCFALCARDVESIHLLDGAQKTLTLSLYNKVHYARDAQIGLLCLLQIAAIFVPWIAIRMLWPSGEAKRR